ncbi:MAG: hypothetical protein ACI9U6_002481 [Loktanella salsilacus]|jgi:hypothetical protein
MVCALCLIPGSLRFGSWELQPLGDWFWARGKLPFGRKVQLITGAVLVFEQKSGGDVTI